jgi:hypothetical protein
MERESYNVNILTAFYKLSVCIRLLSCLEAINASNLE